VKVPNLYGDFSLNAANTLSVMSYLSNNTLQRLTFAHDLNINQILDITDSLSHPVLQSKMDFILQQHLTLFHTEYCLFCRYLSTGDNYTNCGHPCESNEVNLRSLDNKDHIVLADQGCRNTIFQSTVQLGTDYLYELYQQGVRNYRIELVDESPEMIMPLVARYERLFQCVVKDKNKENKGEMFSNELDKFYKWFKLLRNKHGQEIEYDSGTLKPVDELAANEMKPTAYQSIH
jgi:collagenase-like PrtC family protease